MKLLLLGCASLLCSASAFAACKAELGPDARLVRVDCPTKKAQVVLVSADIEGKLLSITTKEEKAPFSVVSFCVETDKNGNLGKSVTCS